MRQTLLAVLLVFLAAAHSAVAGLPDVERTRVSAVQYSAISDVSIVEHVRETAEKCCMKDQIENSAAQPPCSADCTYLVTDVELRFSGCPVRHDPHDRIWRAPVACHSLLRPPIV